MKHNRFIIAISFIGLAAMIAMLNLTSPTEIGPFGVSLFFTTIYVTVFGAVTFIMRSFYRLALKRTVFRTKDYLYAAVAAFGPILILMERSFGALNIWILGVTFVALFLVEFLLSKKI